MRPAFGRREVQAHAYAAFSSPFLSLWRTEAPPKFVELTSKAGVVHLERARVR